MPYRTPCRSFTWFQSTRPCGARRSSPPSRCCTVPGFNPRARAGRDYRERRTDHAGTEFQSTRPCGARPNSSIRPSFGLWFQSTRPCGARQRRPRYPSYAEVVSIHAPVRGATAFLTMCSRSSPCFNPRARAGRDKSSTFNCCASSSFNPRARAGRDDLGMSDLTKAKQFQSTRPCGARRQGRIRHGSVPQVSIHAPVRGATCHFGSVRHAQRVSIHAPVRGATSPLPATRLACACFNPRARAGRDETKGVIGYHDYGFNPRARAGRDRRRAT